MMIFHKRLGFLPMWGPTYFETPGDTSGGQGAAAGTIQPPASGQGGEGGLPTAQQGGLNWEMFPTVGEQERPLVEPHLRNVLGHVTRLEQQYAPLKPMLNALNQAGIQPQQMGQVVQGLVRFNQNFEADPVGTWVNLGRQMQEAGELSGDIDFDEVQAIIDGTINSEAETATGLPEDVDPNSPLGMALARVQELEGQFTQFRESHEQERTQAQQAREDRFLRTTVQRMKTELGTMGVPDEAVTDEFLTASLITHRGDPTAALNALKGFRNGSARNVVERHTRPANQLTAPRGAPPVERKPSDGRRRDGFGDARTRATQFLENQNRMARETG